MSRLERLWWAERPSPAGRLALLLLALPALLFRLAVALRAALYAAGLLRATRAAVPVISVGNLGVGGAGKTPVALAVAERLAARGRRAAVLSRGYGATRRDPRVVSDGARVLLGADEGGDEPVLLARRLPGVPVLCGPRRADLLPLAAGLGADVLLLDDGLQHRALARDLDLVVLDAVTALGNGRLLPAGPLREPPRRRGARDVPALVWLTRVDQAPGPRRERLRQLARAWTGRDPVESRHAATDVLDGDLARRHGRDALRGRRVFALSGVALPERFRKTLEELGAEVAGAASFPDHHRFAEAELDAAFAEAGAAGCDLVVTTEKDAVRLPAGRAAHPRLRVVRIAVEVTGGQSVLDAALDAVLHSAPAAAASPGTP